MLLGEYETITYMGYGSTDEFDYIVLAGKQIKKMINDETLPEPLLYVSFLKDGSTDVLIHDQETNKEFKDIDIDNEVIEYARRYRKH